jgi:PAS domain S-box-containing protein
MFSVPTLTIGHVGIVVHPVASAAQLREILDGILRIRGIDHASIDRLQDTTAYIQAHATQPVSMASELRAAIGPRVVSCSVVNGQIRIELTPPTAPPRSEPAPADRDAGPPPYEPRVQVSPDHVAAIEAINERSDVSIFLFDHDQRFTAAAGALHKRFGYEFALMQGKTAERLARGPLWELLRPGFSGALDGRILTVDAPLPAQRGTVEAEFRPLRRDGAIVGGMVTFRDVTSQRAMRRALAESSAALTAVFARSSVAMGLLTIAGRWARANDAMRRLLGASDHELLGLSVLELLHPADVEALLRTLDAVAVVGAEHGTCVVRIRGGRGPWTGVTAQIRAVRSEGRTDGVVLEVTTNDGAEGGR